MKFVYFVAIFLAIVANVFGESVWTAPISDGAKATVVEATTEEQIMEIRFGSNDNTNNFKTVLNPDVDGIITILDVSFDGDLVTKLSIFKDNDDAKAPFDEITDSEGFGITWPRRDIQYQLESDYNLYNPQTDTNFSAQISSKAIGKAQDFRYIAFQGLPAFSGDVVSFPLTPEYKYMSFVVPICSQSIIDGSLTVHMKNATPSMKLFFSAVDTFPTEDANSHTLTVAETGEFEHTFLIDDLVDAKDIGIPGLIFVGIQMSDSDDEAKNMDVTFTLSESPVEISNNGYVISKVRTFPGCDSRVIIKDTHQDHSYTAVVTPQIDTEVFSYDLMAAIYSEILPSDVSYLPSSNTRDLSNVSETDSFFKTEQLTGASGTNIGFTVVVKASMSWSNAIIKRGDTAHPALANTQTGFRITVVEDYSVVSRSTTEDVTFKSGYRAALDFVTGAQSYLWNNHSSSFIVQVQCPDCTGTPDNLFFALTDPTSNPVSFDFPDQRHVPAHAQQAVISPYKYNEFSPFDIVYLLGADEMTTFTGQIRLARALHLSLNTDNYQFFLGTNVSFERNPMTLVALPHTEYAKHVEGGCRNGGSFHVDFVSSTPVELYISQENGIPSKDGSLGVYQITDKHTPFSVSDFQCDKHLFFTARCLEHCEDRPWSLSGSVSVPATKKVPNGRHVDVLSTPRGRDPLIIFLLIAILGLAGTGLYVLFGKKVVVGKKALVSGEGLEANDEEKMPLNLA